MENGKEELKKTILGVRNMRVKVGDLKALNKYNVEVFLGFEPCLEENIKVDGVRIELSMEPKEFKKHFPNLYYLLVFKRITQGKKVLFPSDLQKVLYKSISGSVRNFLLTSWLIFEGNRVLLDFAVYPHSLSKEGLVRELRYLAEIENMLKDSPSKIIPKLGGIKK